MRTQWFFMQMFFVITLQCHQTLTHTKAACQIHLLRPVCHSEPDTCWQLLYNLLAVKQGHTGRGSITVLQMWQHLCFSLSRPNSRLRRQPPLTVITSNFVRSAGMKPNTISECSTFRFELMGLVRKEQQILRPGPTELIKFLVSWPYNLKWATSSWCRLLWTALQTDWSVLVAETKEAPIKFVHHIFVQAVDT